ncbi:MAG: DNA starvation/stationary phase protection protein [Rickettsiales bacterium]|nr:DNA starvation/stationary phase protection protein [Rickettsiales bacterium]
MRNHKTIECLEKTLANSYALALKLQNYHWNVEGKQFKALHEMFEDQYNELFGAIDEIAERIRALGSKVEGTLGEFFKESELKKANKDFDSNLMVQDLADGHEFIAKQLQEFVKTAQAEGDEATADMFIARIKTHEKAAWMLRSSL